MTHRRTALAIALPACFSVLCAAPAFAEAPSALVATEPLEPATIRIHLPRKTGILEAIREVALAYEVSGRIEMLADEGDVVDEGAVVSRLGSKLETAQRRQARLRFAEASQDVDRLRGLEASHAASAKSLDAAKTQLEIARTQAEIAVEQIERRRIVAPFAGMIAETMREIGEVSRPAEPIAILIDTSRVVLPARVAASQVGVVREGASVLVEVAGIPSPLEGTVTSVADAAPRGSHLFLVEVEIANPRGRLRPGMSAVALIETSARERAVRVPLEVSALRDGRRVVFFAAGGVAHAVPVDRAPMQGDDFILSEPLPSLDLIVRGQRAVRDGAPIRVDNRVLRPVASAQ